MHAPSISFFSLFDDIEYEVSPVISGHGVTLTYNLHLDDGGPVSAKDPVAGPISPLANERIFREVFEALLGDPEFLADGGMLGFGLRHTCDLSDER